MKKIRINDDFNLDKIVNSGQSFRAKKIDNNLFRFCSGDKVLYIQNEGNDYFINPVNSSWANFWSDYFDLDLNYQKIRSEITGIDPYIDTAINYSQGIRILKQDPYETLLSFIIAQRKTIPSIATCVEEITKRYGHPIISSPEKLYSFPQIEQIAEIELDEIVDLKLGYRSKYFKFAIDFINKNNLDFTKLEEFETNELIDYLKQFYGVGDKVANCVALFGYHRLDAVPVDVWIDRSIKENFNSKNPFKKYGKYAGLVQQYLFYYERNKVFSK